MTISAGIALAHRLAEAAGAAIKRIADETSVSSLWD
jgi:hypothetical protein